MQRRAHACSIANAGTYIDSRTYGNASADPNTNTHVDSDTYINPRPDSNSHSYRRPDGNPKAYCDASAMQ